MSKGKILVGTISQVIKDWSFSYVIFECAMLKRGTLLLLVKVIGHQSSKGENLVYTTSQLRKHWSFTRNVWMPHIERKNPAASVEIGLLSTKQAKFKCYKFNETSLHFGILFSLIFIRVDSVGCSNNEQTGHRSYPGLHQKLLYGDSKRNHCFSGSQ